MQILFYNRYISCKQITKINGHMGKLLIYDTKLRSLTNIKTYKRNSFKIFFFF